ncbi:hypothetical protein [Sorangium sp. So ce426]|uniref:hypothetical protein n=1 Tax=Sorangium sp. So ce426 TaxID=3133312 RepID=UPI003F5B7EE0
MADPKDAFSTLDDFLLSLADGISHAQAELTRAAASGPPGASVVYQLPRVEFELKMNLTVVEDQALSQRYRALRPIRPSDKHLLFRPLTGEEASSTLEIAATVKGAFIAVPPNGGLPAPLIRSTVDATAPEAPIVRVAVSNAAGEPLVGVEVQINVDREESVALNQAAGRPFSVAAGTAFDRGQLTTDDRGVAHASLSIGKGQEPGLLVIVVDVLSRTDTLVYEVKT